jgi:hypothetical protein
MTTKSPVARGRSEGTPIPALQGPSRGAATAEPALPAAEPAPPAAEPAESTPGNGHAPEPALIPPRTGNRVSEQDVTAMFDDIAPVYDRLNTVMTLGADARWRRHAVRAAGLASGGAVIDVACGTGKLAAALADQVGPFGRVLAVDLSPAMIAHGAQAN